MTVEALLGLLDRVHRTGPAKWKGRCPAHLDCSPSLAITEQDDRILLHCFAGCSIEAVCQALGITLRDLFTIRVDPKELLRRQELRRAHEEEAQKSRIYDGRVIDARREAEALLRTCRGHDISQWSPDKLDRVMNSLGRALAILREEDREYFYGYFGAPTERL